MKYLIALIITLAPIFSMAQKPNVGTAKKESAVKLPTKTTISRVTEAEGKIKKLEALVVKNNIRHTEDSLRQVATERTLKVVRDSLRLLPMIEFDPPWYLVPLNAEGTKYRVIYSLTKPSPEILSPVFKKKK